MSNFMSSQHDLRTALIFCYHLKKNAAESHQILVEAYGGNALSRAQCYRRFEKSLVYADKPQTLDHLEDIIRRVIADIRPQILEKVIENWTSRLDYIRASRGSPMPEIIFKM
ncbi:hypothetical protein TNCV_2334331 [Trichonephila clavipes]|nr:hypothetical protein TNCV_2334331 [Trichonephila clavipes]